MFEGGVYYEAVTIQQGSGVLRPPTDEVPESESNRIAMRVRWCVTHHSKGSEQFSNYCENWNASSSCGRPSGKCQFQQAGVTLLEPDEDFYVGEVVNVAVFDGDFILRGIYLSPSKDDRRCRVFIPASLNPHPPRLDSPWEMDTIYHPMREWVSPLS